MKDPIERQAAIDIVTGYAEQLNGYIGTPNDTDVYAYARGLILGIERNLNALQSTKPEIVRCKDCKHVFRYRSEESAKKFGQIYECRRGVLNLPKLNDFCSKAERRTDGKN